MALALNTPMADALAGRIQPKLVEIGWSGGEESSPLSEYICLMLVNGKSQEQIASELSGDLLGLAEGDTSATEFAQWLFAQLQELQVQNGGQGNANGNVEEVNGGDLEMEDSVQVPENQDGIPTGPKAMRGPGAGRRLLGQLGKAMDRSAQDAALHRVRPQGQDRVDKFKRDPPRGPSNNLNRQNGRGNNRPGPYNRPNGRGFPLNGAMSQQHEMAFYQAFQQQAHMMNHMNGGPPQPFQHQGQHHRGYQYRGIDENAYGNNLAQPPRSGSLFDRIQAPLDDGIESNASEPRSTHHEKPEEVACKFGTGCTKPECIFGHPSPSAPAGRGILYVSGEKCPFAAGCRNRKCTGSHPSPASANGAPAWGDKSQADCKFFPNCTNPSCPFKHPSRPPCRNGANCTRPDCHFSHTGGPSEIACRFNPCLNPACGFKHEEGQQQEPSATSSFGNKVWTPNSKPHVSERRFVNDAEEELILPGGGGQQQVVVNENEMDTAPVEDGVE